MKTIIFLDDEREPSDVTWIDYDEMFGSCHYHLPETYSQWYDCLRVAHNRGIISECVFSFDHDIQGIGLDGCEITGYDCLKSLISLCLDNGIKIPECIFHTKNIVGKQNMEAYYQNALKFEGEQNV